MDLGECVEVLEKKDQSDVAREAKAQKEHRVFEKEFRADFKAKRAVAVGRKKVAMPVLPVKKFKTGVYTQSYLQSLAPTGAVEQGG